MSANGMAITAAVLAREDFLRGIPKAQLTRLATAARDVAVPERHRFFEEGGRADRFWLIQSGYVALDLHLPGHGTTIIETFGRGAVLGWSWLFPPYEWRFGAVAAQPVRAIEFDGRLVRTLCAADPELGYELTQRFTGVVLERLQATRIRLLDLYSRDREHQWPCP